MTGVPAHRPARFGFAMWATAPRLWRHAVVLAHRFPDLDRDTAIAYADRYVYFYDALRAEGVTKVHARQEATWDLCGYYGRPVPDWARGTLLSPRTTTT